MAAIEPQIQLAKTLAGSIRAAAAAMTPAQLALPSACEGWQVQDVLSHLIGGAERQTDSMRRGRNGDAGPPPGFVPADSAAMSAANAQRDIARRQQLGAGLLPAFDTAYAALQGELDALSPADWQTPCWHLRRGAISAADYLELRIQELAIHDWDLRRGLDSHPQLHPESVATLLEAAPKWLRMCFRPGEKPAQPEVYEFDLAPPHESGSIIIRVTGGDFDRPAPADAHQRCTVCAEAPAFLLFIYGRITGAEALAANEFAISGDPAPLDKFQQWFRGV